MQFPTRKEAKKVTQIRFKKLMMPSDSQYSDAHQEETIIPLL